MRRAASIPKAAYQYLHIHGAQSAVVHSSVECYFTVMMQAMRLPIDCELHVRLVPLLAMRQLHSERKGQDRPTDVLTFPGSGSGTSDIRIANELLFGEKELERCTADSAEHKYFSVFERDELLDLGDIYVCPAYIKARCQRYPRCNLKLCDYARAAYVHAFLHALGYDHTLEREFTDMTACEKWLARRVTRTLERKLSSTNRKILFENLL
jgi:rRNA maturation RNase YbeY